MVTGYSTLLWFTSKVYIYSIIICTIIIISVRQCNNYICIQAFQLFVRVLNHDQFTIIIYNMHVIIMSQYAASAIMSNDGRVHE